MNMQLTTPVKARLLLIAAMRTGRFLGDASKSEGRNLTGLTTRALVRHPESAIHASADAHLKPMLIAVNYAFMVGRKAYKSGGIDAAVKAVKAGVLKAMPSALLAALVAGGKVAVRQLPTRLKAAGAQDGHPFYGNQWTSGTGKEITIGDWSLVSSYILSPRINEALYGTRELDDDDRMHLKALDKVIAAQPEVPKGTELLRTVTKEDAERILNSPSNVNAGFMSTSKSLDAIGTGIFENELENEGMVLLKVEVGDRVRGLDVNEVIADFDNSFPTQEEVILDRGLTMTVLGQAEAVTIQHWSGDSDKSLNLPVIRVHVSRDEARGLRGLAGPFRMRFDVSDPRAVQWAKDHAAELAVGISDTTRERIANAIARAEAGEGLDEVYNEVLAAVGDEARAEVIARTEIMTASNEGQRQGWEQAADKGLLDPDSRRVWIATEGACPLCDALDGKEADLDGEYPDDGGEGPPLHPNCRCTEGISA